MRQFIYKMVVIVLSIILVYEFTIGKKISQFGGKVEAISSKEGRKETVNKLREEISRKLTTKPKSPNTYTFFVKTIIVNFIPNKFTILGIGSFYISKIFISKQWFFFSFI